MARTPLRRLWTIKEDAQIVEAVAKRADLKALARKIKRTSSSVERRASFIRTSVKFGGGRKSDS